MNANHCGILFDKQPFEMGLHEILEFEFADSTRKLTLELPKILTLRHTAFASETFRVLPALD